MLDDIGVQYINEYGVTHYAIDNYLPDYNLMIEVMGDYWHCNPTVYDRPKYRVQEERVQKDILKHSYIESECHLQPLYLWEKDICNRPHLCRCLITAYIQSDGVLPYYHSYNWNIQDDKLIPNESIVPEYENTIKEMAG